ncbi:MAG: Gfo/Idh/MocA family oxidoreductase [Candidatus Bathyarchaeota archaeon]|nr:Gfo/Idh/MocA family oxidoreductase [Candidatus Bathyarchaeota archaeon]
MVVKIGLLGCGDIAWYHMRQIQAHDDAVLSAVYNRGRERLEKLGAAAGLTDDSLFTDVDRMFAEAELDAVVNCLPNRLHSTVSVAAFNAGLHVLCEKPMATSLSEAKAMVDAARKNKRKLLIGLTKRFQGDSIAAKQLVMNGTLGDVYYSKAGWMRRNGIPGWGSWFTRRELAGAGPIYDIGVHALDLTCWLGGNFDVDQVLASSYAEFGPEKRGYGDWGTVNESGYYDVEDLASAFIKMKDGSTVAFEVSWAANVPSSEFSVMVLGDKAGLDMSKLMIHSTNGSEVNAPLEYKETDSYWEEMSHFIDCIVNDREPVTKPDEMLGLQRMLDMILLSARENRVVKASEV